MSGPVVIVHPRHDFSSILAAAAAEREWAARIADHQAELHDRRRRLFEAVGNYGGADMERHAAAACQQIAEMIRAG